MRRKKGLKGVSIVASLFCLVMVFWGGCIQIGRSHPCDTDQGGSVGCDGDDVCHEGWCVPKGWTGINDEVISGSEHRAGSERSGEQFFDGGSNDKGSQYEGQTKEAWSTEQSKGNEIAGQEIVLRDGCAFVCKLGESRFCFGGQSGCDVKGNCKGLCRMGKQYCHYKDGCPVWSDCFESKGPESETCNGEDDDCDGLVDEALKRSCYSGPSQTQGVGNCKDGQQSCVSGQWGACTGQQLPKAEECNKIDDDCDGQVDEGCSCLPGTTQKCGASDIGECQKGTQTCSPLGEWSSCTGEQVAGSESCNNEDDDCDGQTDEDLKRPCYSGKADTKGKGICKQGEQTCTAGNWGACIGQQLPEQEKCDGLDNDCNGSVDEADPILDRGCTSQGVGYCKPGLWKCTNKKMTCTIVRVPQAETCNGKDDDCDGSVDESLKRSCYSGTAGTSGKGICKNGSEMCTNGTWGACTGEITPQPETCNGKDDDCDGSIDGLIRPCYTASVGCVLLNGKYSCKTPCMSGSELCSGGNWSGVCKGEAVPKVEVCNLVDDDCDGGVDENVKNCLVVYIGNQQLPPNNILNETEKLSFDSGGNAYVVELGNYIRKIDTLGNVSIYAGDFKDGYVDGHRLAARFLFPKDIITDHLGNIYIAEVFRLRKIDVAGNVTTVYDGSATSDGPGPLAVNSKNEVFFAYGDKIFKLGSGGTISLYAGGGSGSATDGPRLSASFTYGISSIVFDKQDNLYIVDSWNHKVRLLSSSGVVSTYVGTGKSGLKNGPRLQAELQDPSTIAVDSQGNLYIGEKNDIIRKVDSKGVVSTFAGDGMRPCLKNGPLLQARFCFIKDLVVHNDILYIANARLIHKIILK